MTPSATGTLAATPLAHALVYARNRRLTGRLELSSGDGRAAAISLWCGSITSVETVPVGMCPGGFLGAVVYELGYIDSATLDATLLELSQTKRLHGEILLACRAITAAQRDEALVEQIHRKVHHLFSLPEATTYAFFDMKPSGEPSVAVDSVGPIWRGIRDYPPERFVSETVRRVGDNVLRATTGGSARLPPTESALMQALAAQPMTLAEMKASSELPPARVELLMYLLVIAKCVESVSGVRTHPSTGALPASMPSGPVRIPSSAQRIFITPPEMPVPGPPSSSRIPAPPSSRIPGPPSSRPAMPISSSRPVMPASASRIPTASGSTPRMPAATGSTPRMPAASGSAPRMPAQNVSRPPPGTLAALRTPAEYGLDGIAARAATIDNENYFEVLGVAEGASAEGVRAAFMRLAKTWHPDKLAADFNPVRADVATIFTAMMHAQKTLCDPDARRQYIEGLHARTAARPRAEVMREISFGLNKRNFDYVIQLCQELIDVDSDDSEALAIQAWASVRCGEADDEELRAALVKMDRAVNVDRTCDEAIFHRGLVQKRLSNVPAAFRDFARALQLNPRHVGAEREVRIFAMRARKGSGEHKLVAPLIEKLDREARKK